MTIFIISISIFWFHSLPIIAMWKLQHLVIEPCWSIHSGTFLNLTDTNMDYIVSETAVKMRACGLYYLDSKIIKHNVFEIEIKPMFDFKKKVWNRCRVSWIRGYWNARFVLTLKLSQNLIKITLLYNANVYINRI